MRGNVARQESDCGQKKGDRYKGQRIQGADTIKQPGDEPREYCGSQQSQAQPGGDQYRRPAEHKPKDVAFRRADRETNAEFPIRWLTR